MAASCINGTYGSGDMWLEESLPDFCDCYLLSDDRPVNGKIYTMFHGTNLRAAKKIIANGFKQSSVGMLGRGVYVSRDIKKASRYPLRDRSDQVILKVRVNVGEVKKIDRQGHPMRTTWHDHGYDTAWVPAGCSMVDSRLEEDCVWDPKRIKVVGVVKAPQKSVGGIPVIPEPTELNGQNDSRWEETLADSQDVYLSRNQQPKDDRIYVMFHGTTLAAAKKKIKNGFRPSMNGILGKGIYVTRDVNEAANYPLGNTDNQVILKLKVNVGKVIKIDQRGDPLQRTWQQEYDTAYVPAYCGIVRTGIERDCVWDPKRIKVVGIVDAPPNYLNYLQNLLDRY